jgi:hypothetical protein
VSSAPGAHNSIAQYDSSHRNYAPMTECLGSHQLVFFQATSEVGKWQFSLALVTVSARHVLYRKVSPFRYVAPEGDLCATLRYRGNRNPSHLQSLPDDAVIITLFPFNSFFATFALGVRSDGQAPCAIRSAEVMTRDPASSPNRDVRRPHLKSSDLRPGDGERRCRQLTSGSRGPAQAAGPGVGKPGDLRVRTELVRGASEGAHRVVERSVSRTCQFRLQYVEKRGPLPTAG